MMNKDKIVAGFIGAGGIARAHAYALGSLRYYYNDAPEAELEAVSSATKESRDSFAEKYGFRKSVTSGEFFSSEIIDTVYILVPNNVHYEHFRAACEMQAVKRIYLEKPVCSTPDEEKGIVQLVNEHRGIRIQVGFQYLLSAPVREALKFWKSGVLGRPLHFDLKYYHGDYLQKGYRGKRANRLTPAPDGGAMADLGSHVISLLIAFLGEDLQITGALQAGRYEDVSAGSDLFSLITIIDRSSRATGIISASRISSGSGDLISLEIYAENGAIRYSTASSDFFEYFLESTGIWNRIMTGSNFKPSSTFPSGHVPPGWLRSMVHAHYVFLTDNETDSFVPDIAHGLAVQRIVRQTADHLKNFRDLYF
jgi:predicted dehydrogenase